jgi:type IV pilus assembly protein PilB
MAQRMVRRICQSCKEEVNLSPQQVESLGAPKELLRNIRAFRGVGCSDCNQTGKAGRTGIFEVMAVTPNIERLILDRATDTEIRQTATEEGMYGLRLCAIDKMKQGLTDLDEVFAVTA